MSTSPLEAPPSSTWHISKDNIDSFLTMSVTSQRLKLTLTDNKETRFPVNTYSNSWTFSQLIEKNDFFSFFDDITNAEDIIKSILDNPHKYSIIGQNDDAEISLRLQLPKRNCNDLVLNLTLLEKSEDVKRMEEEQYEKLILEKMLFLEQSIFNLGIAMKEVTDKNNIEWKVKELPPDVVKRCRENWVACHPEKTPPWVHETQGELKIQH